jgi:hypothetical protein
MLRFVFFTLLFLPLNAPSKGLYFQYTLAFTSKRIFTYSILDNKLSIQIEESKLSEIEKEISHSYENPFVKRLVVKENKSQLDIDFFLINNSKIEIFSYSDPFRIVVYFFDPTVVESIVHENHSDEIESAKKIKEKRLLVQAFPDLGSDIESWQKKLEKIPDGRLQSWNERPFYIYPIDLSFYEKLRKESNEISHYAYNLYMMGHEQRSILVYQEILHKNPKIFEESAVDLWIFSELHFAHNNMDLANSYYKEIETRFKGSPFEIYSKIRQLDILSIDYDKKNINKPYQDLIEKLDNILFSTKDMNAELFLQVQIRKLFWLNKNSKKHIPDLSSKEKDLIIQNLENAEIEKTKNISVLLVLNFLINGGKDWDLSIPDLCKKFFSYEKVPFFSETKENLENYFYQSIIKKEKDSLHDKAISIYQSMDCLVDKNKDKKSNWSMAESYRALNQKKESVEFYNKSIGLDSIQDFKSYFWIYYFDSNEKNDNKMSDIWSSLSKEDKKNIAKNYKSFFEDSLLKDDQESMPAKILLESWLDVSDSVSDNLFSKSLIRLDLIKNLEKKFKKLNLEKERKSTLLLLKEIDKKYFNNKKDEKKEWLDDIILFAEEMRNKNDLIESGELYIFAGENSEVWENRSEFLYKGGLLLERSGKKDEAMSAFTKASQDTSNILYSSLAKEKINKTKK